LEDDWRTDASKHRRPLRWARTNAINFIVMTDHGLYLAIQHIKIGCHSIMRPGGSPGAQLNWGSLGGRL